jgi:signal transduction histidine kinase
VVIRLSVSGLAQLKRDLFRLALIALAYFVAARLSLNLALVHGQVTPVWPPTGIALVAFLLFGRSIWPAIYLAAFAINLPIGPSPLAAAVIAIGNTLAPLVAAELLKRVGFHREIDRLRDALGITFLAALGSMLISATVGTSVLLLEGAIDSSQLWPTWAVWWAGDAMGVLLVAPFLLSVMALSSPPLLSWRSTVELVGLVVATAAITFLLFQNHLRLEYLVLPLIMVSAWRFRLRGAAPAALVASGVAIASAVHGIGPFADEDLFQKMVTLQAFNVSLALASFVLASFVDAREREEKMARLYAAAESANKAKSHFLHLAAHELRTPISVLTGYLSMLSDGSFGPAPEGWKRPLDVLATKTKELNRLVADLLDASRLEAQDLPRVVSQVDVVASVREAIERARPRTELLSGHIVCRTADESVSIQADRDQLARILDNLLNNALTYNTGAPQVIVSITREAGSAAIRVCDNGVGVPARDNERIFEQFHRSHDGQLNVPGTGLGLYISRKLAKVNGGRLVLESSSPGDGSVFLLSLPVAEPQMQLATPTESTIVPTTERDEVLAVAER